MCGSVTQAAQFIFEIGQGGPQDLTVAVVRGRLQLLQHSLAREPQVLFLPLASGLFRA